MANEGTTVNAIKLLSILSLTLYSLETNNKILEHNNIHDKHRTLYTAGDEGRQRNKHAVYRPSQSVMDRDRIVVGKVIMLIMITHFQLLTIEQCLRYTDIIMLQLK